MTGSLSSLVKLSAAKCFFYCSGSSRARGLPDQSSVRIAPSAKRDFPPLDEAGCVGQSLTDIRLLQVREIGREFRNRATRGNCPDDHPHGYAHAADTRFPPITAGLTD